MTEQDLIDMVADANNPETPAERVNAIYEAVMSSVRAYEHQMMLLAALARNPNTPPNHLEWIAMNCPEEVLQNPALLLFILEDPSFPRSSVTVERMAKFPHCPEAIKRRAMIRYEEWQETEHTVDSLMAEFGMRKTTP